MIDTVAGVRTLASEFLAGAVSLEQLDRAVAQLGEMAPFVDEPEVRLFWGPLELLLAERSSGHLDDVEFRTELAKLVPVSVVIGARTLIRVSTSTSARSFTNPGGGLFQEDPSPAVGTRVLAVSA